MASLPPERSRQLPPLISKASRWLVGWGIGFLLVIGLGLLILLTQATTNRERYNQNYEWLLIVNAVVAAGLLLTILWGMVRLLRRLR